MPFLAKTRSELTVKVVAIWLHWVGGRSEGVAPGAIGRRDVGHDDRRLGGDLIRCWMLVKIARMYEIGEVMRELEIGKLVMAMGRDEV